MKTKMRLGASVVAALVAAAFVGIVAPAAYADDTTPDSNATSVATESIVADDASTDSSAPAAQDSTDTTPAPDSSASADAPVADVTTSPVADTTPSDSTPEPSGDVSTEGQSEVTAPAAAPAVQPNVPAVSSSVTVYSIDLLPYCFKGQPGFAGTIQLQNSGAEATGPLTIGPSDNPGQFAYGDVTVGSGADIGSLFNLAPGTYSMAVSFNDAVIGGPYSLTIPADICGPVVTPSAQVTSIVASAVDGSTRSVPTSGTVSTKNVTDTNTVLVVVSDDKGHTSAPITIDAQGNYSTVLTGTFPDGVTTVTAQANLLVQGKLVPTGTPKSTTVEFSTVVPLVASASAKKKLAATCEADSTVTFTIENAVWADNGPDLSPGTHVRPAVAIKNAVFPDGEQMQTVQYTIDPKLPEQSTDPEGACYKAPTPTEPEQPQGPSQPATPVVLPEAPKPAEPIDVEASDEDATSTGLAQTGQDGTATGALALVGLLALGGGLVLALRRRRATQ